MENQLIQHGGAGMATTNGEYFKLPGLSNSAMKDLAVSPLRFWYNHLRPDREPEEPTAEMNFGSALHCAVLEPSEFHKRYCCAIDAEDFPDCLRTADDLRGWLKDHGLKVSGNKDELISRVMAQHGYPMIYDVAVSEHGRDNAGKVRFKKADWERLAGCAHALANEPRLAEILKEGRAEVALAARDPETGVMLKGKLDWVTPHLTVDLKTYSVKRDKSIDKTIADAIYYEGYHRQAFLYSYLRKLTEGEWFPAVYAFVESDPPHEVRLRLLKPKTGGNANLYWMTAQIEVREMIRLYRDCQQRFGDKPWRDVRKIDPLVDDEIKQLNY